MTREQYEILKKYERNITTATQSNYIRGMNSTALNELDGIYRQLFGVGSKIPTGCSHCVVTDLKRIGAEYFRYQKVLERTEEEEVTNSISDNKPKRGRPKSQKKNETETK